jgi:pyruvate-ferredoxin/flavodoxin oxidoreductase
VRLYLPACGDPPGAAEQRRAEAAPAALLSKPAQGAKHYHYHLAISPLDCSGCGNCVDICPSRGKALAMQPLDSQRQMARSGITRWRWRRKRIRSAKPRSKAASLKPRCWSFPAPARVRRNPLCALDYPAFGDRMMIANATGCSSIWGPARRPFLDHQPQRPGPAWANSLFEDNAEFGLGMMLGGRAIREQLASDAASVLEKPLHPDLQQALRDWLENKDLGEGTRARAEKARCWRRKRATMTCLIACIKTRTTSPSARSGFLAATAGPMILALAASIMCWPPVRT